MEWIANNWFLLLIIGAFAGMRYFGLGCCGQSKQKNNDEHDNHAEHSAEGKNGEKPKKAGHGCCG